LLNPTYLKTWLIFFRPINPISKVQIISLNEHPDPIIDRVIGAWKEL
jgi:hypothetical protein